MVELSFKVTLKFSDAQAFIDESLEKVSYKFAVILEEGIVDTLSEAGIDHATIAVEPT
jgi:hypothetical protein